MLLPRWAMVVVLLAAPCAARGEPVCPWVTDGTAAAALGGPVQTTVALGTDGQGSCRFAREPGASRALDVAVSLVSSHACPPGSKKVAAIGNEASVCRAASAPGETSLTIESRVRTLHFTVRLRLAGVQAEAMTDEQQQNCVHDIAEQVAGALF